MTLDEFATVANILASLAVVASLIFVGVQLRQSSRASRMTAAQLSAQILAENLGRVSTHGDLAELLSGERDRASLSAAEQLRITNFLSAIFRHFEVIHTHRRYGLHEEELWRGTEMRLRQSLQNPPVREWWEGTKSFYSHSFVELTGGIIREIDAAEAEIDM